MIYIKFINGDLYEVPGYCLSLKNVLSDQAGIRAS